MGHIISTSKMLSTIFTKLVNSLKQDLFESWCCLCNEKHHNRIPFCSACLNDLPWTPDPAALADALEVLPDNAVTTLFDYQFPVNTMLRQFKYQGQMQWGENLCALVKHRAGACFPDHFADLDIIIPAPLSRKRLGMRGFNQSEVIAKAVSGLLDIPVGYGCCLKIKDTTAQAELDRAGRQSNLVNAFKITNRGKAMIAGRHLLVVDDVTTTGTTLKTLKDLLMDSGARQVSGFCLAHTPPPLEKNRITSLP
ncbi:MAG: amidophosphoribosyltransferase [Proteobacteria bacterium]|nr:MAG: amidophosphoribosyltransferase [Pseudomonadota bacterium]